MAALQPIIVKKKISHGGHHGGAWKVAYADFVTAMMALFIVLWLMNSSKQIQEAVQGYFKDPAGTSKKLGTGQGFSKDPSGSSKNVATSAAENLNVNKDNMNQLKEQLQKAIRQSINFEKLKNQIEMTVTAEGLRIELLEGKNGTFFESGKARPTDDGADIMIKLAMELGKLPNKMAIEGHTDAKPYAGDGDYGNWELSADRGNAARRLMQKSGLGPKQVTQVRGYADQRLRKPADPEDPSNRRISLIVRYIEKPEPEETQPAAAAKPASH